MKKLFTLLFVAVSISAFSVNVTFQVNYSGELPMDTMFVVGDMTADDGGNWLFKPMIDLGDGVYSWSTVLNPGDTLGYYYIKVNSWDSAGNQDWDYFKKYRETIDTTCKAELRWDTDRMLVVPDKDTIVASYWEQCPGFTSIFSNSMDLNVKVYPNPSNGLINIEFPNPVSSANVQVYDFLGKMKLEQEIAGNNTAINMENLPKSVYLLRISTKNGVITKKLHIK